MDNLFLPPDREGECVENQSTGTVVAAVLPATVYSGAGMVVGPANTPATAHVFLPPSVPDPLEPFNRLMWDFNVGLMTDVIKPTSEIYRFVVVKPVRTGIGNFGRNLTYPGRLINNLLQENGAVRAMKPTGLFATPPSEWPGFSTWGPNGRFRNPTRILARPSDSGAGNRNVFDAAGFWTEQRAGHPRPGRGHGGQSIDLYCSVRFRG
jgi:hypothetical protein